MSFKSGSSQPSPEDTNLPFFPVSSKALPCLKEQSTHKTNCLKINFDQIPRGFFPTACCLSYGLVISINISCGLLQFSVYKKILFSTLNGTIHIRLKKNPKTTNQKQQPQPLSTFWVGCSNYSSELSALLTEVGSMLVLPSHVRLPISTAARAS